ncbi:hybrid sensor histidine kinase/response regulator [Roseinatronobacter alkalisoli]|uniref:histidine kinase n=1 Tax=Roseinatronobacter alkalisoli TaxID=3028235 RepID=A0ABT5TC97_9RHOB|nr:PAS domain-containing sensor histidine kinase [Roseinatronobacter sp. HJB301]MDD7971792.1 ATP-binding protein [Roseinatronobacter sp. HJB301]
MSEIHPRHLLYLALAGGVAAVGAMLLFAGGAIAMAGAATGVSFVIVAGLLRVCQMVFSALRRHEVTAVQGLLDNSAASCFLVSSRDSRILWRNNSARARFGAGPDLAPLLDDYCARVDSFIARLHDQASARGNASRSLSIGAHPYNVEVVLMEGGDFLWRIACTSAVNEPAELCLEWARLNQAGKILSISPTLDSRLDMRPDQIGDIVASDLPDMNRASLVQLTHTGADRLACRMPEPDGNEAVFFLPVQPAGTAPPDSDAALNQLPVAIAHIAPDGTIAFANREARRLLHINIHEQVLFSDRLEGLGRPIAEWMEDVRSGRLKRSTEVMRLVRHGVETYIQVSLRELAHGPAGFTLAVMNDATELKSLEAKFTQSQKMQAIGQLAGGVAHDFNNLLTAISGHCELILMRHDSSDVDYPDLMQIQQNTNRAAALVRQLLAFSRKQTLQFETLDLQVALAELVHLLNRLLGAKFALTLRYADQQIAIRSDRRQFEQILVNLVVNARDSMPQGGEVVIETAIHSLPDGLCRDQVTLPPGDYAVIEVRDKGQGIPRANLSKLFEPFFTTKRLGEGTGLGLSTVYGLVKQMGGFIFIDSEEGAGTTVRLYFKPQHAATITPRPAQARTVMAAQPGKRRSLVLLVEDEAPVRSFAARALQLQGYRVLEAESGEAALQILADDDICPDLFVTDVIMPGIDGPGWVKKIRAKYPDTPVIFISGYAEDSRSAAQARIDNSVFLAKPFSLSDFTATVNAQLLQRAEVG